MATLLDYYSRVNRSIFLDIVNNNVQNFIETGTGLGDTVDYVVKNLNKNISIYSIEIYEEIADKARRRFINSQNCNILNGNSYEVLADLVPKLSGNCMFFLDAHFPGADFGYTKYSDDIEHNTKLPLQKELELICSLRDTKSDVFLIDDLRIYEEGNFEMGNWPKENGAVHTGIDFIYDLLGNTHNIQKHYFFSGFVTILPKK